MDFAALAELCAPSVEETTLSSIVSVESSFNPFAIGVVGGQLERQPRSLEEAVATADMLRAEGYNYSLGLAQVNQSHLVRFGLSHRMVFDPCNNLRAGAFVFEDCYSRAKASAKRFGDALSCYNSGNFSAGYRNGYVTKVMNASLRHTPNGMPSSAISVIRGPLAASHRQAAPRADRPQEALLTSTSISPAPLDGSSGTNTALLF